MALKPEVPCTMARLAGDAESVNPGCGVPSPIVHQVGGVDGAMRGKSQPMFVP